MEIRENELYAGGELAEYFKVSPKTIYNWRRLGKLVPSKKVGSEFRYTKEDIDKFVRGES